MSENMNSGGIAITETGTCGIGIGISTGGGGNGVWTTATALGSADQPVLKCEAGDYLLTFGADGLKMIRKSTGAEMFSVR